MSETKPQESDQKRSPSSSLFAMEEAILERWQSEQTFEKSLKQRADAPVFSFYDGPPFITGTPHYGTLLPSIAKDIIPRFQTMKGKLVRRTWGWDVHGLPAENQVEKKLGLKTKKDIEALGVDKFIAACREYVGEVSDTWRWYIDHIGRWADMENAYRTDNLNYMESVMAVFKKLYEKDLIYRGRRVSLYCPRCATPLSKFEVTMDEGSYKDVEDPAVTVAFRLLNDDVYLLAWTTTPWTLPANLALAVDPAAEYVRVTDGKRDYILAHQTLERYGEELDLEIKEYFKGAKLVGERYEPLYSFLPVNEEKDHRVLAGDFVTTDEGTGIVHIAPGFGEDDTKLGEKEGLSLLETLDDEGHFIAAVTPWAGQYYKKANPAITDDLRERELLIKEETITHSYPHCYRCATPLIYKAQVSWYLRLDPLREQLIANNKKINWLPKHFGAKRFLHNLETAPDWSLSRTRYWGSPIPVWESEDGGEIFVAGSIKELEELSGQKVDDLHRPAIDQLELTLPSGKKAKRVKEVLDCWFESGAMPYAQDHYPFENVEEFERHFPADFIIEYTGQLRGWFYYLHVLANALKGENAFKNVVVTGVLMGTDGRKMSKSFNNYPDPKATIEKYGAESLRLYFMSSKVMQGDDPSLSEDEIRDYSRVLNVLHNSFQYYRTYANLHGFKPAASSSSDHVLDRWIRVRAEELTTEIDSALSAFDFAAATKAIRPFIEDLSTWYIRRNRDRFVAGDTAAPQTLHDVLRQFALSVAPILPFSAEQIFETVGGVDSSVHLQDFPASSKVVVEENAELLSGMALVRAVCSAGNMLRAESGMSLRQPLSEIRLLGYKAIEESEEYQAIVAEELNVKHVSFGVPPHEWPTQEAENRAVALNVELTDELKQEGRYRELARLLQEARKKAGLQVGEKVALELYLEDETDQAVVKRYQTELTAAASLSRLRVVDTEAGLEPLAREPISLRFDRG